MKQYLLVVMSILMALLLADYLVFYSGVYVFDKSEETITNSKCIDKSLYLKQDAEFESFKMHGVNLSFAKAGKFASEHAITTEEYLIWFKQIQEMGANIIKVNDIGNPDFYEAIYSYNQNNPEPLYILQGVSVDEYLMDSSISALDDKFFKTIIDDSKDMIDVIHGKHKQRVNDVVFPWHYKWDVSKWVYGFVIGNEWNGDIVVLTNESEKQLPQYYGEYIYTEDARNFEICLAYIADNIIDYESSKYAYQHALAFGNGPFTCPLKFSEEINFINKKYGDINVETILPHNNYQSGFFAAYQAYPFMPEFVFYEDENTENTYLEYLERLNDFHDLPVVITEFGVSTSRATSAIENNRNMGRDQAGLDEKAQGLALVSMMEDIQKANIEHMFINSWQDDWSNSTWNTEQAIDLDYNVLWHDIQSANTSFGLMAFDIGEKRRTCYVDGEIDEWSKEDLVINDNYALSIKYDEEAMYFMVEGANLDNDHIFIALDITPNSGSTYAANLNLNMSEDSDFIIELNGQDASRVWVNNRYNTLRALHGHLTTFKFNQYTQRPSRHSNRFDKIEMLLNEKTFFKDGVIIPFKNFSFSGGSSNYYLSNKYETGKLLYANGNPDSVNYNSLADIYSHNDIIEIRIPWLMLNIADPINMRIHDDYYDNYGVEYLNLKSINVGIGDQNAVIEMRDYKLNKLKDKLVYHERLKASYYIVQAYLNR